jgi:hypothetical protein
MGFDTVGAPQFAPPDHQLQGPMAASITKISTVA